MKWSVKEQSTILHEYDPKWKGDFARLNYEWIERSWRNRSDISWSPEARSCLQSLQRVRLLEHVR